MMEKLPSLPSQKDLRQLLAEAADLCRARGGKLTPLRERVLSVLLAAQRPVKAYDLIQNPEDGRSIKPPTIYRTLDFLVEMGLAHRIESLQAFFACGHWKHDHAAVFLICSSCGRVNELNARDSFAHLKMEAASVGFISRTTVIEVRGACDACS